jgi:hypothetical protein
MIADSVTTNAKRRFMQRGLRLIFCDSSVSGEGWRIDNVDIAQCNAPPSGGVQTGAPSDTAMIKVDLISD